MQRSTTGLEEDGESESGDGVEDTRKGKKDGVG